MLVRLVATVLEARGDDPAGAPARAASIERAYATLSPPWVFQHPRDEAVRAARELNALLLFGLDAGAASEGAIAPRRRSASR